jgi:MFS family permease
MGIRAIFIVSLLMIAVGCFAFVPASISLATAITAVVLIGIGVGLPYAGMFSRAGALFPGRAGAAMGLVNMLGILMILGGAPLVGHLADLTGNFRVSFIALGSFSLLVCAAVPFIHSAEPARA